MKKILRSLPLLLCIIVCFTGCSKNLDLALPAHEPLLVLNGVFHPDSVFMVDLSSNNPMSSNQDFPSVTNASAKLFRNGQFLTDLHHSKDGIYKAQIKPQALEQYQIKVTAPDFPPISATSNVPSLPVVEQVIASVSNPRDPVFSGKEVNVSLKLEDGPAEENFYFLQAYTYATDHLGKTYTKFITVSFISPDEYNFQRDARYFFSDKVLKAESTKLILHLETDPSDTTILQIARITPEYYKYGKTFNEHHYADHNINKTAVFNNVQNGLGLFAGYNAITISIKP